jgi:hypothetical protein
MQALLLPPFFSSMLLLHELRRGRNARRLQLRLRISESEKLNNLIRCERPDE